MTIEPDILRLRFMAFVKFTTTQLVNSQVNPEIREMLLGHKIGLASAYLVHDFLCNPLDRFISGFLAKRTSIHS
jgi:hypothetical protein